MHRLDTRFTYWFPYACTPNHMPCMGSYGISKFVRKFVLLNTFRVSSRCIKGWALGNRFWEGLYIAYIAYRLGLTHELPQFNSRQLNEWGGVIRIRGNSMSCTEWESELNCPYAMSYTQIHTLIQQTHNSVNDPHSVSEIILSVNWIVSFEWPQTISPSLHQMFHCAFALVFRVNLSWGIDIGLNFISNFLRSIQSTCGAAFISFWGILVIVT